jgi:hypothetical protein
MYAHNIFPDGDADIATKFYNTYGVLAKGFKVSNVSYVDVASIVSGIDLLMTTYAETNSEEDSEC